MPYICHLSERRQTRLGALAPRIQFIIACALLVATIPAGAQGRVLSRPRLGAGRRSSTQVKTFGPDGILTFEIRERTGHPFYWWPRTLLRYPVRFDGATVTPDQLSLLREDTGEKIPFQLSGVRTEGGHLTFASVHFFSDLPSGATRRFTLTARPAAAKGMRTEPSVTERREKETIVLDSGAVKVRIPASRDVSGEAPGPLLQIARDERWFGGSRIVSPRRRVRRIITEREESGALFITYKITCLFEGNARYTTTVRCTSGMDFVELSETMEGLAREEGIYLETTWTGFHPTHRQAPNHPYQPPNDRPGYGRYDWERIDQGFVGTQHGVSRGMSASGELPFRLGPYQPWGAYVTLTSANFWDERATDALGLFIDKAARWQDHEYAVWYSADTLQIRYFFKDHVLSWRWPLVTGTRSTAIACYDHHKDIRAMEDLESLCRRFTHRDGLSYQARMSPMSHVLFLQNRYGTLDLNLVKDWVLEYPDTKKRPPLLFKEGAVRSAEELEQRVLGSELVRDLPVQGTRQNAGFSPVPSRQIYDWWIDAYNRLFPQMNARQRQRLTAIYLLMAYTHAEEDYMPMKTMLAGHPNFLSDVKSVPAFMAFLFPEHPRAREWEDEFQKFIELNTRYHTRPGVASWQAKGGRWTENLGTYVWAFLRPAIRAAFLLVEQEDGKNRLVTPQMAQIGGWIVDAQSAPFAGEDPKYYAGPDGRLPLHYWGLVTPKDGPRRLHPPQGAHSARRMPPRTVWLLGDLLRRYRPLLAEHLMWSARPTDDDAEHRKGTQDAWSILYEKPDNRGTNPHLKSSKYTGYGIVLRAGVDTPDELSLHLQQIDEGPNYRWGIAGEGGCGVLYYYAGGRSYSHNGREDVGDRAAQDTDFCTNFGVWKNGSFRSIGRNVLDRPLYDLGIAQFAEIAPRQGSTAYSWPEYQGRSVLLVGGDYFVTYDHVFNDAVAHRFSWFTHIGDDLPFLHLVKGGKREGETPKTQIETGQTKGVWYDGLGDCMAVITHKPGITVEATGYGCRVTLPGGRDHVFREPKRIDFSGEGLRFRGTAGLVRNRADGSHEIALFHGSRIEEGGVTLTAAEDNLAISARWKDRAEIRGTYKAAKGTSLGLEMRDGIAPTAVLYIDGAKQEVRREGNALTVLLPEGEHDWQLTPRLPAPPSPRILRTEDRSGGATVFFTPSAGAARYRVELSRDGGTAWERLATTTETTHTLSGIAKGTKVHVRAIALNDLRESAPSAEYPVYVTEKAPRPPDGLTLHVGRKRVDLSWGEVLGVREYRVYRRVKDQGDFARIYQGRTQRFTDENVDAIPAFPEPGAAAAAAVRPGPYRIYEYAVSAVTGNGEGARCVPVDTDPANWLNWDPKPGEPFRRRYSNRDFAEEDDTSRYYPTEDDPITLRGAGR